MNIFADKLAIVLTTLFNADNRCYLVGDFNIDCMSGNFNSCKKNIYDLLLSFDLKAHVNWVTRISKNSTTCIDQIFTNEGGVCTCVLDNTVSDHRTLFVELGSLVQDRIVNISEMRRNFSRSNLSKFINELEDESFGRVFECNDIQSAYMCFTQIVTDHFEKHFPLEKVSKKSHKKS